MAPAQAVTGPSLGVRVIHWETPFGRFNRHRSLSWLAPLWPCRPI